MNKKDHQIIGKRIEEVRKEIRGTEEKLMTEIRYNGVLMESLQDSMKSIMEGFTGMCESMEIMRERWNLADVDTLPVIRHVIKGHSKRITKLEAKAR